MFLSEEEDLVLDADFRGDFVLNDWVYSSDDPTFNSFERLSDFRTNGTTLSNLNQRYTVAQQTAPHRFGYYAPAIQATVQDGLVVDLNFVVHVLPDDNGEWTVCETQCHLDSRNSSLNCLVEFNIPASVNVKHMVVCCPYWCALLLL